MLAAVFGFGGRINRLQYFLGCVGLGAGVLILATAAFVLLHFHMPTQLSVSLGIALLLGLLGLPALIWISFSLQARRFRDMGWNPLFSILSLITVAAIDQIVGRAVLGHGGANPLRYVPMLGGLINLVVSGCLLFWPGVDGGDFTPNVAPKAGKPAKPAQPPRAQPEPVVPRTAPSWTVEQPRTSFGRRGL